MSPIGQKEKMSLAETCRNWFEAAVRRRGDDYFRRGLVELVSHKKSIVHSCVRNGSGDTYSVTIPLSNARPRIVDAECTCRYFEQNGDCKHLWATLLELDAANDMESNRHDPAVLKSSSRRKKKHQTAKPAPIPNWIRQLSRAESSQVEENYGPVSASQLVLSAARPQLFWYAIDVARSSQIGLVVLDLVTQQDRANGQSGSVKDYRLDRSKLTEIADPVHRDVMTRLLDCVTAQQTSLEHSLNSYLSYFQPSLSTLSLKPFLQESILPMLARTGRLCWRLSAGANISDAKFVAWDDQPRWSIRLNVVKNETVKEWQINADLVRDTPRSTVHGNGDPEVRPTTEIVYLDPGGVVLFSDSLGMVNRDSAFPWLKILHASPLIRVPFNDHAAFLEHLTKTPALITDQFPADFCPLLSTVQCQPGLKLLSVDKLPFRFRSMPFVFGVIEFRYGDLTVRFDDKDAAVWDKTRQSLIRRDSQAEVSQIEQLLELGAKPLIQDFAADDIDIKIPQNLTAAIIRQLVNLGWQVEAQGIHLKKPGQFRIGVTSGIDWFELNAEIDFDGVDVSLPALLEALKRGDGFVMLADGGQGILPEEWLRRYGNIAALGQIDGDKIRFRPSQAMILDALLDAQDHATRDKDFTAFCQKIRKFSGVKPKKAPRSFCGELRDYQKDGLGWLCFLNEFGLGGCLADDMGLGKTIQVLSLLEGRRTRKLTKGETRRPSLVVVPKSLVGNWLEEANKFVPKLRVVNYTGVDRVGVISNLASIDVLVTTYGTLRNDIVDLKEIRFDYVVLDEAQAIKNAESLSAKACRLLNSDHRLAMTGTPVENHLDELWSLFEFLNPGMLGASSTFQKLMSLSDNRDDRDASLNTLALALRPFMLRRTKQQVLTELPGKTEQTIYCEMPPKQRKMYDELRMYYRTQLTSKIESVGLKRSKIQVLEALLRLRQAACHPGLIDKERFNEDSGKLHAVIENLKQLVDEGHKALVFSQFTSLLAIVRHALDAEGICYEYLDGKTRNRQEKVNRFQTDTQCPLFLISLKAGGNGLNLTAADYVFILDPWWNPAVEAQAVDRAHRMGQDRHVFAYRLICRDTVEERILELQKHKKGLADAIVNADASLIRNLSAEDLQLLLS